MAQSKANEANMSDNPELDEALAKIDHRQAVQDLAVEWGATYRQAKTFADALADRAALREDCAGGPMTQVP
jgi:hypothetical protein